MINTIKEKCNKPKNHREYKNRTKVIQKRGTFIIKVELIICFLTTNVIYIIISCIYQHIYMKSIEFLTKVVISIWKNRI